MPGFQPRHDTDPVWFGDTQVNNLLVASQQTGVRLTAIHGWDDRPDVRDVRELRSGQDGEYADNLYLGGRTITVEGEVYGSSWVDLQARKRVLAALFQPASTESVLKVPDPATAAPGTVWSSSGMTGYERASVRVVEAIQFGDTLDPACQVWQVVLRASDPRVYSDVETSTDSGTSGTSARTVTVDQGGSYETPPTLTVTGPATSPITVSSSDGETSLGIVGLGMVAGDTLQFDCDERTITLASGYASTRLAGALPPTAIWMMQDGGSTADNSEGTAALDGTFTGGYSKPVTGFTSGLSGVDLNGTTGYVSLPNNAALYPASVAFEVWAKFDTLSMTQTIVDGLTSNRGFRLSILSGSQLELRVGNGSSTVTSSSTYAGEPLVTGRWYRFVVYAHSGYAGCIVYAAPGETLANYFLFGFAVAYANQSAGGYRIGSTLAGAQFLDGSVSAAAIYPASSVSDTGIVGAYPSVNTGASVSAYSYLDAATARWANLGTGSTTYTLNSSGLNTGSKLNVAYRDARV